jgi:RNA polymerase sigma-70 factor (ECF subfamily)
MPVLNKTRVDANPDVEGAQIVTQMQERYDEHKLLALARGGSTDAFAALQALLMPPARAFTRRLIGEIDEDIVQEAFFALYMNLDKLDPPEKLRPFLFRVIRNRCYDRLRAQGRYDVISLDEDVAFEAGGGGDTREAQIASDEPPPDERTHWLMIYAEVQQAMEKLPELQRQALILYSEAKLSYEEIAEAMDVGIGTVKSRLYYAKRNLVRLLPPETLKALEVGETSHV